jgi:hypothetical protein
MATDATTAAEALYPSDWVRIVAGLLWLVGDFDLTEDCILERVGARKVDCGYSVDSCCARDLVLLTAALLNFYSGVLEWMARMVMSSSGSRPEA